MCSTEASRQRSSVIILLWCNWTTSTLCLSMRSPKLTWQSIIGKQGLNCTLLLMLTNLMMTLSSTGGDPIDSPPPFKLGRELPSTGKTRPWGQRCSNLILTALKLFWMPISTGPRVQTLINKWAFSKEWLSPTKLSNSSLVFPRPSKLWNSLNSRPKSDNS